MAHECPECGMTCHCGGDIDDIVFSGTPEELSCTCCDCEDDEDGFWPCQHCSQDDGTHLFGCPNNIDPFQNLTEEGYD